VHLGESVSIEENLYVESGVVRLSLSSSSAVGTNYGAANLVLNDTSPGGYPKMLFTTGQGAAQTPGAAIIYDDDTAGLKLMRRTDYDFSVWTGLDENAVQQLNINTAGVISGNGSGLTNLQLSALQGAWTKEMNAGGAGLTNVIGVFGAGTLYLGNGTGNGGTHGNINLQFEKAAGNVDFYAMTGFTSTLDARLNTNGLFLYSGSYNGNGINLTNLTLTGFSNTVFTTITATTNGLWSLISTNNTAITANSNTVWNLTNLQQFVVATNAAGTNTAFSLALSREVDVYLQSSTFYLTNFSGSVTGSVANGLFKSVSYTHLTLPTM
jgi:hypothetical protein